MSKWPTRSLAELCEVRIGRTPRRDTPKYWGGSATWLTIRDLNQDSVSSSKEQISDVAVSECMPPPVPAGTLLFSFKLSIGRMAIAGCPLWTNEAIAALPIRDPNALSVNFLKYALMAKTHDSAADSAVLGKLLNKKKVEQIRIPVPPLAEQNRIVKLLDEADAIRKLRAQADQRTADLIPALFHQMFGDPVTNPMGWPIRPFGELAKNQDGKRKPVKESDRAAMVGEVPYYGASGIIDHVDEHLFDEPGLLIAEDGANLLARSSPVAFMANGRYWVNNHAHVVSANGKAELEFLCHSLELRDFRDYVTGSAQPKLNQANLNAVPIATPPINLQREFVRRVDRIRGLRFQQRMGRANSSSAFGAILHREFL